MKSMLLIALSVIALNASAESIKIFSKKYNSNLSFDEALYELDTSEGSAWINISIADDFDWEDTWYSEHRVGVPGMAFDQNSQQITIVSETGLVVCAQTKLVSSRFGRSLVRKIFPTGNCQFRSKVEYGFINSGYGNERVKLLNVYIVTR